VVVIQRYQGSRVDGDVMASVMAFFMMFFITLGVGSVVLIFLGLDPITAVSGAATCLSNIGPGLGSEIGPAGNFSGLPDSTEWVMGSLMLAGRLEVLTLFVIFLPLLWRA
jgi:trk system potassium uptake protein